MSVVGTGVDIIEIGRISKAVVRSSKFLDTVFTTAENNYFHLKKNAFCHIAGNFAAKEAVMKVLGTGLRGFGLKDIEVKRDDLGKPYIELYGGAAERAVNLGIKHIHLSISHSRDYAVAVAVGEDD